MAANAMQRSGARRSRRWSWSTNGSTIGVGTGSTVNFLIEALAAHPGRVTSAVASSQASRARLRAAGVALVDLNDLAELDLYIDGADEATARAAPHQGGRRRPHAREDHRRRGGRFVCIIDESKIVAALGGFPLPVEVIPIARSLVARQLAARGGRPVWREGFVTDNGNHILDVHGLTIADPLALERDLNQLAGVVTVGLFAARPADVLLVGTAGGVETR